MSAQAETLSIADECEKSAAEWRNEVDTRMQAAAELRRLVAENEAKDALLRQAVQALEPMLSAQLADGTYADKDCKITFAIAAIRQHLGQKGGTQ